MTRVVASGKEKPPETIIVDSKIEARGEDLRRKKRKLGDCEKGEEVVKAEGTITTSNKGLYMSPPDVRQFILSGLYTLSCYQMWKLTVGPDVKLENDLVIRDFASFTHLPSKVERQQRGMVAQQAFRYQANLITALSDAVYLIETLMEKSSEIETLKYSKKQFDAHLAQLKKERDESYEKALVKEQKLKSYQESSALNAKEVSRKHVEEIDALKRDNRALEAKVQRLKDKADATVKRLKEMSESRDFYERHGRALKHHYQRKELVVQDRSRHYKVNYRSNFLRKVREKFQFLAFDLDNLALLSELEANTKMTHWSEDMHLFSLGGKEEEEVDIEGSESEDAESEEEEALSYHSHATSILSEMGEAEDDALSRSPKDVYIMLY